MRNFGFISLLILTCHGAIAQIDSNLKTLDPSNYYWLEELEEENVLKWVDSQNDKTLAYFNQLEILKPLEKWHDGFKKDRQWDRIQRLPPAVDQVGPYVQLAYGKIWRRMNLETYMNGGKPEFNLGIDMLMPETKDNLEFDDVVCRGPEYNDCLVYIKKSGNRNLKMLREFDANTKTLVDGGFKLPATRSQVQWRDENSVYLTINTESPKRFANKLYIWERGQLVEDAKVIYQTDEYDVRIKLIERSGKLIVAKEYSAYNVDYSLLMNDELIPLPLPVDLKNIVFVSGQLIVHLKSGWQPANEQFPSGSLISIDFESFLNGSKNFNLVMPSSHELVLDQIWNTNDILIVRALKNVQSELYEWTYDGNSWTKRKIENPQGGNIIVTKTQNSINRYYFGKVDFFGTTEYVRESNGEIKKSKERLEPIESNNYNVEQWFATSKDGTQVPYFVVYKKGILMDGNNPVIMTGYGGWGNSILPYSLNYFSRWLEDGGVFVLANIRGGGEYGPEWHYAAIREKRQVAFDDFQGIAEDLIAKKVASPKRIGITGASNGGLLVTISFIQNPELYGAVLSRTGSIELQRCSNLSGAPPTGERGDGNIPEDWAYMKTYSPFHNLEPGRNYPPVLLFSNRGDDVSHPCHSRKFTYRMNELGYDNVYYIETDKGGHGNLDVSNREEMELAFFYKNLHPKYKEIVALEKTKD